MMKFKALHLFCGIGGGALGFQQAREEWKGVVGSIESVAGIDCDPEACEDFGMITGDPAYQMDLFSKEQYRMFHNEERIRGKAYSQVEIECIANHYEHDSVRDRQF
jgi:site-specific DNA-cytosine methylase